MDLVLLINRGRAAEALNGLRGGFHQFKQVSTDDAHNILLFPELFAINGATTQGVGWIGGMVQFIDKQETRFVLTQRIGREFNLAFKAGLGTW